MSAQEQPVIWAAWHPRHGFDVPLFFSSSVAFADLDDAAALVSELNAEAGTNNRTGWRAVKVRIVKVDA
jgi:hypothetical protein